MKSQTPTILLFAWALSACCTAAAQSSSSSKLDDFLVEIKSGRARNRLASLKLLNELSPKEVPVASQRMLDQLKIEYNPAVRSAIIRSLRLPGVTDKVLEQAFEAGLADEDPQVKSAVVVTGDAILLQNKFGSMPVLKILNTTGCTTKDLARYYSGFQSQPQLDVLVYHLEALIPMMDKLSLSETRCLNSLISMVPPKAESNARLLKASEALRHSASQLEIGNTLIINCISDKASGLCLQPAKSLLKSIEKNNSQKGASNEASIATFQKNIALLELVSDVVDRTENQVSIVTFISTRLRILLAGVIFLIIFLAYQIYKRISAQRLMDKQNTESRRAIRTLAMRKEVEFDERIRLVKEESATEREELEESLNNAREEHVRAISLIRGQYEMRLLELANVAQLEAARAALRQFAPTPPPFQRPHLTIAASFKQGQGVYGDFFNWQVDNKGDVWVYLVDVEGKGFAAALFSTLLRYFIDSILDKTFSKPREILTELEREFEKYETTKTLAATMNMMKISYGKNLLELANAGMPPPLLFRKGQSQPVPIQAAGVYVGLGYSHFQVQPPFAEERINSGDLIVAYTDGVLEARSESGGIWGQDGIASTVLKYRDLPEQDLANQIISSAAAFSASEDAQDDQCVVVIRIGNTSDDPSIESAPALASTFESSTASFTILNCLAAIEQMHFQMRPELRKWIGSRVTSEKFNKIWCVSFEVILNSLKHGTGMGDRIRVKYEISDDEVRLQMEQPNSWRDWDKTLGQARKRNLLETPGRGCESLHYGTWLILKESADVTVHRQGKLVELLFKVAEEPNNEY